ncbi:MAG TPA: YeeE/YedE thiosulfate transporter family protein [Candidatus Binatia bacterium]|jgi:hypothetical protein
MNWLRKEEWPWWQAGLLLGLLNIAVFYTANYYLSASTTFSRAAGMLVQVVAPAHVAANAYWQQVKPILDWQFMLVIGIPMGAFLAARLSHKPVKFTTELPQTWVGRFGTNSARRWLGGLLGGIFVGFGARLADGCTSGHALSGGLQLAVSSWIFLAAMMLSGMVMARFIFRSA